MYRFSAFLIATSLLAAPALAEEWSCSNEAAEITCGAETCEVKTGDDFTPSRLTVNANGEVSLCAYSGCWEGQAVSMARVGRYVTAVGLDLPWSAPANPAASIAATIDTQSNVAVLLADGFAHPMTCTTR